MKACLMKERLDKLLFDLGHVDTRSKAKTIIEKGLVEVNGKLVKKAGEKESGLSIHYVNEEYDKGKIILQDKCKIEPSDTAEEIAAKVLKLEHKNYAKVVEEEVLKSI